MIIIDKPFVSKFLIETIEKNNFQIISTSEARDLIPDESLNWISEDEAISILENDPNTPLYTNSENSISWIENNFSSSNLPAQIDIFKNKLKFRELLKDTFPNFFFKGVKFEDLRNINFNEVKFPFIIKPAVGFFSIAVYKVNTSTEWNEVLTNIESEIKAVTGMYPEEVIGVTEFIIEEFIDGEEYAIDCYFNNDGEPVLLNILHHLFSSDSDVSDRVYSTSEEIIKKHKSKIHNFLKTIGEKVNLKNFPAHVEVRIDGDEKIHPIEVNPLRFGGWCTTGDLSQYAFGFNSYEYFLNGKKPDWDEIFKTRKNAKYNIIVLDNNSGIEGNKIEFFDYKKLLGDFTKPLSLRKADYRNFPLFGFLFTETKCGDDEELNQILTSDLRKYIKVNG